MDMYANTTDPAHFSSNFPHGSFHYPSTQVNPGTWAQGLHYTTTVSSGDQFISSTPPSGPAAGETFLLVAFGPNVTVNTGFAGAYSITLDRDAFHYSDLGPGTEYLYAQSFALAKATSIHG